MVERDRRRNLHSDNPRMFMDCRLCWHRIQLDAARVSLTDGRPCYRCQVCDAVFLIRRDDVVALGAAAVDEASS